VQQTEPAADDTAAIHELLRAMQDAWARGDGAGYATACTDDARYVTASGLRIIGRPAIAESHQRIFDSALRGTHLDIDQPVELRPVASNVVLVHASGAVLFPDRTEAPPRATAMLTMVAVNDGNAWRFASFTNTPIDRTRAL
jgi:uncharacterized protein (TIGR02246 family)